MSLTVNNHDLFTDESSPGWAGSMDIAGDKLIALSIAYGSVSTITCNSVAMTKAYTDTSTKSGWELAVWYLDAPTTGSSVSLAATFSDVIYVGFWDTDGLGTGTYLDVDADNLASTTTIDVTLTTEADGGSFSIVHEHVSSAGGFSNTGDQSEDDEDAYNASGSVACTDASDNHHWTTTASDELTMIAVSFSPPSGGTVVIVNSIIYDNDTQTDGDMTITYSNVEGIAETDGNVNGAPVFLGSGYHEYSLAGLCDAVDSANSGATYYESSDIRGVSRYDHPDQANTGAGSPAYADMGAYEFVGTPINTFDYSSYFLNLNSASGTAPYCLYAIVRLPPVPQNFGGNTWGYDKNTRHQISSEIRINDSENDLTEYVTIDNHIVAKRVSVDTVYANPTRSVDYESDYQSDGDAHVAEETQSPTGIEFGPTIEGYRYVLITMAWESDDVAYTGNEILIFNVDIHQIQDDDFDFDDFFQCVHPGATWMGPDVPLSAFHMHALQDSLLKILYEAINSFSIPVFGRYAVPVV